VILNPVFSIVNVVFSFVELQIFRAIVLIGTLFVIGVNFLLTKKNKKLKMEKKWV